MISERDTAVVTAAVRPTVLQRLRGTLRPGGYDPGDRVQAPVKDAQGVEHATEFEILSFCGGGFAGQVYRSRCITSDGGPVAVGQVVALKFFSPRSGFRRMFRDVLYRLCFLTPFSYQYNEDSVRAGLALTRLLQIACQVRMGSARPINEFYGTFWDAHVGSFAEVNEWVSGGVTEPVPDDQIILRRKQNRRIRQAIQQGSAREGDLLQPLDEMSRKRRFMAQLCALCRELGLEDLLRQVYWWTGASQPNVLTRRDGSGPAGEPDFVWVDRRPGLPGLILSFGDFPLLARAFVRRSVPPFDRVDFRRLRAWPSAPDSVEWNDLCDQVETADRQYRGTQVDWSTHRLRLLTDRNLHREIAGGLVDYWRRTDRVDAGNASALEKSPARFTGYALLSALLGLLGLIPLAGLVYLAYLACEALFGVYLTVFGHRTGSAISHTAVLAALRWLPYQVLVSLIPLVGRRLQKWMGNAAYREHMSRFWHEGAYRREYFDRQRAGAVKVWLVDGRTTERRAAKCLNSFLCYFTDRILCGWMPPAWQRFFTDFSYQLDCWRRLFTSPFRYIFAPQYRRQVNMDWVATRTAEDVKRGVISADDAEEFVRVAGDKSIQQYITGLIFVATVRSEFVYLALGVFGVHLAKQYQLHASHISIGTKIAAVAIALLVSPGGIARFLFCVVMGLLNRDVPYGTAMIMSPIRAVGDLAFPAQIARTHPRFSAYLLTSTACRLAAHVPVFGERGGLMSLWVVTAVLSWPASLKAWWRVRRSPELASP